MMSEYENILNVNDRLNKVTDELINNINEMIENFDGGCYE